MSEPNGRCVLDASALLAYMHRELGWERIAGRLNTAVLNAVNLSEVATKLTEKGASSDNVVAVLENLSVEVVPCDKELAYQAAALRSPARDRGLSLADRICLATAQRLGLPALTTDRTWADFKIGVRIDLVR